MIVSFPASILTRTTASMLCRRDLALLEVSCQRPRRDMERERAGWQGDASDASVDGCLDNCVSRIWPGFAGPRAKRLRVGHLDGDGSDFGPSGQKQASALLCWSEATPLHLGGFVPSNRAGGARTEVGG